MILLDTSVLIECLTEKGSLKAQFRERLAADEPMAIPTLVLYEWRRGSRTAAELTAQRAIFPDAMAIPFDWSAAVLSGKLYRALPRAHSRAVDIAIAACALRQEAALWTLNPDDFADIPGLKLISLRA